MQPGTGVLLVMRIKEPPPPATIRMNLENMVLSERSHSQKTKSQKTPLIWNVQNNQIYRNRKMRGAARRWKKGEMGSDSSWIPRFLCEAMKRSNITEQGWLDKPANTKNQQTVYIWRVNVIVCELNSNAHSFAWAGMWPVSLGREETWSAQWFLGFIP